MSKLFEELLDMLVQGAYDLGTLSAEEHARKFRYGLTSSSMIVGTHVVFAPDSSFSLKSEAYTIDKDVLKLPNGTKIPHKECQTEEQYFQFSLLENTLDLEYHEYAYVVKKYKTLQFTANHKIYHYNNLSNNRLVARY